MVGDLDRWKSAILMPFRRPKGLPYQNEFEAIILEVAVKWEGLPYQNEFETIVLEVVVMWGGSSR